MDATVRAPFIVVFAPVTDRDFCVQFIDKPFAIQAIISKTTMEAFEITILPWRAWCDIYAVDLTRLHPILDRSCHELRTIVTSDTLGRAVAFAHLI